MEKKKKVSEAQRKASRRWEERNPEKHKYNNTKRMARTFARRYAKDGDIDELMNIYLTENENSKKVK